MRDYLASPNKVETILRKIAKSDYYQSLFTLSKEISGIQIFKNSSDFTHLQMFFLNQMGFYSTICYDIATNEVSEIVLKDEIYEDAYWWYRTEKQLNKTKRQSAQTGTEIAPTANGEQIINRNTWAFTKVKG